MPRCPNCGQITSGDNCQWCNYPLQGRGRGRRRVPESRKAAEEERRARIDAIEKAAREIEEAKEALAADIAAWEKTKQTADESRKAAEAEEARKAAEAEEPRKAAEAEEAKKTAEAEKQAKKQTEKEAKEKAKREAEEAKKAARAEKLARKQAEKEAKEKAKREAEEAKRLARAGEVSIAAETEEAGKTIEVGEAKQAADIEETKERIRQSIEEAKKTLAADLATREKAQDAETVASEKIKLELYREVVEPLLSLPITQNQYQNLEKFLEIVESTNEELQQGKIGTEEAMKRLRDISAEMSG